MQDDPTSLDLLHDIVLPPSTDWWPLAPGWLWLLAALAVLVLWMALRSFVHWQHNRYRREALAELARLAAATPFAGGEDKLAAMAELLKRTALSAWPREQVASLTGQAWFEFLDRAGKTRFSEGLGARMQQSIYQGGGQVLDDPAMHTLVAEIRAWIKQHRVGQDWAGQGQAERGQG
jgi:hypothetical protein